ncbi:hypothetical protein [Oceanivirga salmonicida]|uniref:hypothetical protein n=1 Tax=Oceanivirga salmonicida TaxID=1769291 RepID=UPI0008343219|nr:hypothetical protein [Oceanivirga salmonicida]
MDDEKVERILFFVLTGISLIILTIIYVALMFIIAIGGGNPKVFIAVYPIIVLFYFNIAFINYNKRKKLAFTLVILPIILLTFRKTR